MTTYQRRLQIYFACPISPRTNARREHARIVSCLRPYGHVLTELFVAPGYAGDADQEAAAINGRDLDWLVASDILVADITEPSLGVGYEISKAESWKKPVLCLHRPTEAQVSPMVTGAAGVVTAGYDSTAKLRGALATFLFMLKVGSSPTDRVLEPPA